MTVLKNLTKYNIPEYFNFQSVLSAGQTCTDSTASCSTGHI